MPDVLKRAVVSLWAPCLATAIVLIAAQPITWALHLFWLWLLAFTGQIAGAALRRPAVTVCGAEGALALTALILLWPAASGRPSPMTTAASVTFELGPALRFSALDHAIERTVPLPDEWETLPVFLRVDLAQHYAGAARLRAEVNGTDIGELGPNSGAPGFTAPAGAPAWGLAVPVSLLRGGQSARVVLRPTAVDARLALAIHPDAKITPAGLAPSRFFDGVRWHEDRLAGSAGGRVTGAYRIWLRVG